VDYQNTPEGTLVGRAQSGDQTAFREIVERYQSKVFAIIHGIVRQRNDVEDISQQVFAKVYLSLKNFDFRSSLITWIYKSVSITCGSEKSANSSMRAISAKTRCGGWRIPNRATTARFRPIPTWRAGTTF
jgi:hypothetical protein